MNNLRHLFCVAVAAFSLQAQAQVLQPLRWSADVQPSDEPSTYTVTAIGSFSDSSWHIYDLVQRPGGPNETVFSVRGEGVEVLGEPVITSPVELAWSGLFNMEVGECPGPVTIVQQLRSPEGADLHLAIEWQCCQDGGECLAPAEWETTLHIGPVPADEPAPLRHGSTSAGSLWALILQAVAWGLVALLTPCVFPMIPMTVSFFIKQKDGSGKRLALIFGLSIVLLYTLPIVLLIGISLLTGGQSLTADIFNWLATHWLPNILFFIIFMVFAASFLGAFEIRLPSRLVNSSDAKSDKGGVVGAFFIALTLVLVSFSCTGPIVGSVLIKSAQGQFWEPVVTMLAFSIAFALPFTLFAFAPSLLKKLPRSGGWLGSVKVVLGFVELALGMKFLSVADQTYHWGILDRHVYLAIWIVIFFLLGLYLLGAIYFKGESGERKPLGVGRLALVIADFAFVVYMIPGMWGAPLKALSGYLPPITTQDFVLERWQAPAGGAALTESTAAPVALALPGQGKYSDFLKMPFGIQAFYDFDEAMAYGRATGKPVLLDFTGHGCVNCREMEARVWSDPRVLPLIKDSYVLCSLFADDKKTVAQEDWVTLPSGKVLKGLGKINSYFMQSRFGVNAQPFYALLDPSTGDLKVPARGYGLDIDAFVQFLESGLK